MKRLQVAARSAVRDVEVEIDVAPGEVLAILGPNGAGKSTVLAMVAGLLRPDERSDRARRHRPVRRRDRHVRPPAQAGDRVARPAGHAVPAPERGGKRRVRAAQPRARPRGGAVGGGRVAARGERRAPGRPQAVAVVGRTGAAGRDRPGTRGRTGRPAARRTDGRTRRERRTGAAPPATRGDECATADGAPRHPRPPRRARPRRHRDRRGGGADRGARRRAQRAHHAAVALRRPHRRRQPDHRSRRFPGLAADRLGGRSLRGRCGWVPGRRGCAVLARRRRDPPGASRTRVRATCLR